jgi:protein TonB
MFEYMLESSPGKRRQANPWAYAVSLTIQFIMLGLLILIPLLYTEALPEAMQLTFLSAPPPPPPPPPPPAAVPIKRIRPVSLMDAGRLRAPTVIPKTIEIIKEDISPDSLGVVGGVPGGVPGGQLGGVLGGVLGGIPSLAPPPPTPQKPIRVSGGVQQAKLLNRPEPIYPPIARQARIQGVVQLEAVISRDGTIQNLRVLSGHPLLVQAALQAVQQWRYQPTLLSGEPVEVITTIDVIFRLN